MYFRDPAINNLLKLLSIFKAGCYAFKWCVISLNKIIIKTNKINMLITVLTSRGQIGKVFI